MIAGTIDLLTRIAARLGRRRYRFRHSPVQVNLGSSLLVAPGWVNVDMGLYGLLGRLPTFVLRAMYRRSAWASSLTSDEYVHTLKSNRFIQHDMRRPLPFEDASVDVVFSSHFLDSLSPETGKRVLQEMFRVLRAGGRIRLSVSDMEKNIELYRAGHRQEALERFFPASESPINLRYWMYDFHTLSSAMTAAGFVDITRCDYRQGTTPDLAILDNRPEESLFVEAIKPG